MTVSTRSVKLVDWEEIREGRGSHIRSKESHCYGSRTRHRSPRPVLQVPVSYPACGDEIWEGTSTVCFPARYRIAAAEERDVTLPCLFSKYVASLWSEY